MEQLYPNKLKKKTGYYYFMAYRYWCSSGQMHRIIFNENKSKGDILKSHHHDQWHNMFPHYWNPTLLPFPNSSLSRMRPSFSRSFTMIKFIIFTTSQSIIICAVNVADRPNPIKILHMWKKSINNARSMRRLMRLLVPKFYNSTFVIAWCPHHLDINCIMLNISFLSSGWWHSLLRRVNHYVYQNPTYKQK